MNRLVSIITVTYNAESVLEKTIESVLSQTYDLIEYIIIDACSKDGTHAIIERYKSQIQRVVVEPDDGLYDAMNKGIELAQGEIIGILNAGDVYRPKTVELVAREYFEATLKSCEVCESKVIVTGDMVKFNSSGSQFVVRRKEAALKRVAESMPINHPSTFVGRTVYQTVGCFDLTYKICSDNDFIWRCILEGVRFRFVSEVLSEMELGGVSEQPNSIIKRTKEHYLIRQRHGFGSVANVLYTCRYLVSHLFRSGLKSVISPSILQYYYRVKRA